MPTRLIKQSGLDGLGRVLQRALLMLLVVLASHGAAIAEDGDFGVLFSPKADAPIVDGRAGEHNKSAFEKITRAVEVLKSLGTVRFIFVARHPSACDEKSGCVAEYLMWQRVNSTTAALRRLASRHAEELPFQLIGWSFLDELSAGTELPPEQPVLDAIYLRLYVDASRTLNTCPWRVLIHDPAFPPAIGASGSTPMIPMLAGQTIDLSPEATVAVKMDGKNGALPAAAWGDAGGEFRRADAALTTGAPSPIPLAAARLYLFDPTLPEVGQFLAALGDDFTVPSKMPSFLQPRLARGLERGFEDHAGPAPHEVLPIQQDISHCEFGLHINSGR